MSTPTVTATGSPIGSTADPNGLTRPSWLPPSQWPFELRTIAHRTADGSEINIHYTDEGAGPTLVFVHAGLWSFVWRDAMVALRADHRCISIDFPGTGLSDGKPSDVDIATYPDILDAVLERCGVQRATMIVHDLGGAVGVVTAGRRPDRIEGLVVTNAFAWPADTLPLKTMLRVMGSRPVTGLLGTPGVIPRLTSTRFGVGRHLERDGRRALLGPYRDRATASRNFHRTMRSAARAEALMAEAEAALHGPLSGLPALVVFGENNDQFGFADRWRSLFPSAEQWTVDGGNHFPMCDDPAGYVDRVRSWHRQRIGRSTGGAIGSPDGNR